MRRVLIAAAILLGGCVADVDGGTGGDDGGADRDGQAPDAANACEAPTDCAGQLPGADCCSGGCLGTCLAPMTLPDGGATKPTCLVAACD